MQRAPHVAERLAVGVAGALLGIGRAEVRERCRAARRAARAGRARRSSAGRSAVEASAPKRAAIVWPSLRLLRAARPGAFDAPTPEPALGGIGRRPSTARRRQRSASRLSTNAWRSSSLSPQRFSSNVKPCSERYERFTSTGSIRLSDSLARRITIGLFAAITPASSSAAAIELVARHDALDGAEREQLVRGDHRAGEEHRAQLVLRHEARRGGSRRRARRGRLQGDRRSRRRRRPRCRRCPRGRCRRRGSSRAPPRSPAPRSRTPRRTPRSSPRLTSTSVSLVGSAASSLMSTPAWNPLPSARRITARTSGSRPGCAARRRARTSPRPAARSRAGCRW